MSRNSKLLALLTLVLLSCVNKNKCNKLYNVSEYNSIILTVQNRVVDLTYLQEPLSYKEFKPFLEFPNCYVDESLKFIEQNKENKLGVQISLLSMSNLKMENTLQYTLKLIKTVDNIEVLSLWLCGAYGNDTFVKYHKKENVKNCLLEIKKEHEQMEGIILKLINGKVALAI